MQKYKQTSHCDLELYFHLGENSVQILNSVDLHNPENLMIKEEILKCLQSGEKALCIQHTHTLTHTYKFCRCLYSRCGVPLIINNA